MSGYTTAITNRTIADITTPTTKGLFNVMDWTRIYNNTKLTNSLASIMLDDEITFSAITTPTVTTISGTYAIFNTLISNIERLRLAVASLSIPGTLTAISENVSAFDYRDVNLWESTINSIWYYYDGDKILVCPTLTEDLIISDGEIAFFIDCVDVDEYEIIIEGSGVLHIL
jgi:hypothetical protein